MKPDEFIQRKKNKILGFNSKASNHLTMREHIAIELLVANFKHPNFMETMASLIGKSSLNFDDVAAGAAKTVVTLTDALIEELDK